jgi:hypothetical protein
MDGSSGYTLLLGACKQQGVANPCLEVWCTNPFHSAHALPSSLLIVSDSLFSPSRQVRNKNLGENFEVGSPTRGLCKVSSTKPHMRSLRRSTEGGRQGWGDKSTPGPLHSGAAYFTVPRWTCSKGVVNIQAEVVRGAGPFKAVDECHSSPSSSNSENLTINALILDTTLNSRNHLKS